MLATQPIGNQALAQTALGKLRFCASLNFDPRTLNGIHLHPTAQSYTLFAPMCTSVHLRAPLCGKIKKSRMVHKPHITAHRDQLHQLAEKNCAQNGKQSEVDLFINRPIRTIPNQSELFGVILTNSDQKNVKTVLSAQSAVPTFRWPSTPACIFRAKPLESKTVRKTSKRDHLWLS